MSVALPETERLILRELTADDYGRMYEIWTDPAMTRYYPYDFDADRVTEWIERNIARYRVFGFGLWAVTLRASGEVIGVCGLTMQDINGFIRPEIGYHIGRIYQRQGYASEAARACVDWAFGSTPFRVLHSYMWKSNVPSSSTAKSAGMRLVEEYDDPVNGETQVYAIKRAEWEERLDKR